MLRTRDYFLLLVTIVFLLVAISATILTQTNADEKKFEKATLVPESDSEYSVVVTDDFEAERADRLASLREKIERDGSLFIYETPPTPEPETEEAVEDGIALTEELRCANYSLYTSAWSAAGVEFTEVEGVRLVFRETAQTQVVGTSTQSQPQREILAELPVRSVPFGAYSCIPSNVIGITIGGALIYNDNAQLFAPFAEGTLLGYALDGFPIYGTSAAPTDACGGRTVAGSYRYQLSTERDTVVNCFVGRPIQL